MNRNPCTVAAVRSSMAGVVIAANGAHELVQCRIGLLSLRPCGRHQLGSVLACLCRAVVLPMSFFATAFESCNPLRACLACHVARHVPSLSCTGRYSSMRAVRRAPIGAVTRWVSLLVQRCTWRGCDLQDDLALIRRTIQQSASNHPDPEAATTNLALRLDSRLA